MKINQKDLILILYGGNNAESKISEITGDNVFSSLKKMNYNTKKLFFDENFLAYTVQKLLLQVRLLLFLIDLFF